MKQFIRAGEHNPLIDYDKQGEAFALAIPTPERYLPMLYILAQPEKSEAVQIFNDKRTSGSLAMTSVVIGV